MKALQYAEYGDPNVLRVVDVNEPHAGPGQVRVAVRAVGINPVDWKLRKGVYKAGLPAITGSDVAGVVDEIGDGVTDVS
ncbi:MAG: alcohol dehydrogenase catalytic domain-containing protein, partial [Jiangellaceae bacterium]